MVELRPHQEKALEMVHESVAEGYTRPMVAAPCAFGKTVLAAKMFKDLQDEGGHGVFICDRIKLVQQTIDAFDSMGVTFGVMQGAHERTDTSKTVQIASVQTLQSWDRKTKKFSEMYMINESEVFYQYLNFDLYVIDEAHVLSKYIKGLMDKNPQATFVGLSATPYSKGLGEYYDNLLVPITPRELIDQNYLTPIKYYGGKQVDTSGLKSKALKTGGRDFDPKQLAEATEKDTLLNGDIVKNWVKYAEGMQTIAFSPSINHSKFLVKEFRKAGIRAEHIDGYMEDELRQELYQAHDEGEFSILSCSQLLNTGYDAPQVSCLIDCYPTKSLISYVQRAGRIMRNSPGKEFAVYLDHAGNFKHGPAEDIIPDYLDQGELKFNEKTLTKDTKKEPTIHECPECCLMFIGVGCECGYEFPFEKEIETDGEELIELYTPTQRNAKIDTDIKREMFAQLKGFAIEKGMKIGWAAHSYRTMFGVWPNAHRDVQPSEPTILIDPILDEARRAYNRKRSQEKRECSN